MESKEELSRDDFEEILAEVTMTEEARLRRGALNLDEAFSMFDVNSDDKVDRREQILMFQYVQQEMAKELKFLVDTGGYDEAREIREKLRKLRQDFDVIQVKNQGRRHEEQRKLFGHATAQVVAREERAWEGRLADVEEDCRRREADLRATHEHQWTELELQIQREPKPRVKYSKELLELKSAENNLSRLMRFEEAKNVRRKINALEPVERRRFFAHIDQRHRRLRERLRDKQITERNQQHEKLSEIRLRARRSRDQQVAVVHRRMRNHERDMAHAQRLETFQRPDLSVNPVVGQRPGHDATGSAKRGQQLSDVVKGKREGQRIAVASLTEIHEFDRPLSGTVDFSSTV